MCCIISIDSNIWDVFSKVGTLLIGSTGVILSIVVFNLKNKKDDIEKEHDRRIQFLKTLILDYTFDNFYLFFDNLEGKLIEIKNQNLSYVDKQRIINSLEDEFIFLRRKFIDSLLAVDIKLYNSVLEITDSLETHLYNVIFDDGINLAHLPKFDEEITEKVTTKKTEIIRNIFEYRG